HLPSPRDASTGTTRRVPGSGKLGVPKLVRRARSNLRGQDLHRPDRPMPIAECWPCRRRARTPENTGWKAASVKFFFIESSKGAAGSGRRLWSQALVASDQRLRAHHRRAEAVEGAEQQVGARMGHAGDSKTFLAVAAALMAGLVIATMLAINAKLQSALAPTVQQAGAPAIKMIPPVVAPLLQSTAAP